MIRTTSGNNRESMAHLDSAQPMNSDCLHIAAEDCHSDSSFESLNSLDARDVNERSPRRSLVKPTSCVELLGGKVVAKKSKKQLKLMHNDSGSAEDHPSATNQRAHQLNASGDHQQLQRDLEPSLGRFKSRKALIYSD
ncbi:MAG: hypothetical protein MHMPM18_000824 [Marteilia pararefringens]